MEILIEKVNPETKKVADYQNNTENATKLKEPKITHPEKEDREKHSKDQETIKEIKRDYIRVGDNYHKKVLRPNPNGEFQIEFIERNKGTIIDDFGRKYLKYIPKYEGFGNIPSHINYQQVSNGFFNQYHEISHKPKEGDFGTIKGLLKHIFASHYDFIIDYLHILYVYPTQRLPIIVLESKERGTGKSTYGSLLKLIFENNAIKVGNSDLESDFNSVWVNSLCIIIDEASLNPKINPMIKRFVTETGNVIINEKNRAQKEIKFFGKFTLMSNDEGKALIIERGEDRFAVFKVPTFKSVGIKEDPNIEDNIKKEIPHFLHFLKDHKTTYKQESRLYFNKKIYHTRQLEIYFQGSISYVAKSIHEFINNAFMLFTDLEEINYAKSELLSQLKLNGYKGFDIVSVTKAIENDLGLVLQNRKRYHYYNISSFEANSTTLLESSYISDSNNRAYCFKRKDFEV